MERRKHGELINRPLGELLNDRIVEAWDDPDLDSPGLAHRGQIVQVCSHAHARFRYARGELDDGRQISKPGRELRQARRMYVSVSSQYRP